MDCRSKSEKAGFRSKIFDRDQTFLDFDPERIAIGGRIGNRIETTPTLHECNRYLNKFFNIAKSRKELELIKNCDIQSKCVLIENKVVLGVIDRVGRPDPVFFGVVTGARVATVIFLWLATHI